WCNGSTTGSGPVSRGSNPCRAANSAAPRARELSRAPALPSPPQKYPHPFVRLPRRKVTNVASLERMANESDERIAEVVEREQSRLRRFIRHRLPDPADAEDILPD